VGLKMALTSRPFDVLASRCPAVLECHQEAEELFKITLCASNGVVPSRVLKVIVRLLYVTCVEHKDMAEATCHATKHVYNALIAAITLTSSTASAIHCAQYIDLCAPA